ncbi:MAG: hypothetical protein JSV31_16240 [Desulfobacterales bacterium]|jgi:hypothetical protein|nr:MAG: hypothetical protein JSV31_16240 [Desulfobacterales bacterium]
MITDFTFGKMMVNGEIYTNDLKCIQDTVIPNWWRRSGHSVHVEDVRDILEFHPDILVIGKGEPGFMATSPTLREVLEKHSIELIEEKTSKAIQIFNQLLQEGKRVAAGFHVAC